ncbi:ABC transporter ATP-binding protein [Yinghuangia seranimata]|uniref:ABC transporter ATP-binding protein n=1 Tax=Yinghuangia seranimata TaxID=408067 RepID=UPI00248BCD82|nr:ABC transporter ATP-binding protein [Yinghuangia seranimata]MDI2129240.1 ABC transporter ATP-binding protein [Yinghuangia seranimata]
MTDLKVTGLRVARQRCEVLHGVDAEVRAGGWLAVIGPNGAGKSTLLKAVAGLLPYTGEVTVDGVRLRDLPARELARTLAYTPQNPVVPPQMPVREYVLLGRTPYLGYLALPGRRDRAVADQVIERLDLTALATRDVGTLSGGERQRVVLARALAQQAPVLLLDEPTTALDLGHQQQVLELVDRLRRDDGLTVVTTLHDLGVAAQYAERMLLLVNGEAAASGTAAEVLTPAGIAAHYNAHVEVTTGPDGRPRVHLIRPAQVRAEQAEVPTGGSARHDADA